MKFYYKRAMKVSPGVSFVVSSFDLRTSRYLEPIKQVVAHTTHGESYYMPGSFCRYVATNNIDLDSLIGKRLHVYERETSNGRMGLYVEGEE